MSEGWGQGKKCLPVLRFYCHILGRNARGGGDTPDIIHAYVRWGCHWTSNCMGHIESKITKLKGLLRVFTPYFYWCVCHIKVQRLTPPSESFRTKLSTSGHITRPMFWNSYLFFLWADYLDIIQYWTTIC